MAERMKYRPLYGHLINEKINGVFSVKNMNNLKANVSETKRRGRRVELEIYDPRQGLYFGGEASAG